MEPTLITTTAMSSIYQRAQQRNLTGRDITSSSLWSQYSALVISATLMGLLGVFVRSTSNLEPITLVFFRALIATVFIFLFTKSPFSSAHSLRLQRPLITFLVGALQGASILLYINSIFQISISSAAFLLYSAPIFSVLLSRVILKEKILPATYTGVFFSMVGIFLIVNPRNLNFNSQEMAGNLMALGSGFFYAAMAIAAKKISNQVSENYLAFWQYFTITILSGFFLKDNALQAALNNWWQLLCIGILCTGIAFLFFMRGVRRVRAQVVFILSSLEPLVAAISAYLFWGESLSLMSAIGAALIIVGVLWTMKRRDSTKQISSTVPQLPQSKTKQDPAIAA